MVDRLLTRVLIKAMNNTIFGPSPERLSIEIKYDS